jgi:hypothetical protein
MLITIRRPWVALAILAALAAAALPLASISAEPAAIGARRLDLGAPETKPLADGLSQDLGPLHQEEVSVSSAAVPRAVLAPKPPGSFESFPPLSLGDLDEPRVGIVPAG